MINTKEILLFFKDNTDFLPVKIADELLSRYEELGNPVLLPANPNKRAPLIVFNTNKDFQISINREIVTIALTENMEDKIHSIVFDIVDVFEGYECSFNRIGCIANEFLSSNKKDYVRENLIDSSWFGNTREFTLSWFDMEETKLGKINVWQRLTTDGANYDELLYQFDFNTLHTADFDFTMKNIKLYFEFVNKKIEERVSKI